MAESEGERELIRAGIAKDKEPKRPIRPFTCLLLFFFWSFQLLSVEGNYRQAATVAMTTAAVSNGYLMVICLIFSFEGGGGGESLSVGEGEEKGEERILKRFPLLSTTGGSGNCRVHCSGKRRERERACYFGEMHAEPKEAWSVQPPPRHTDWLREWSQSR